MQKLHSLTTLRFVAAAMIVFHYLDGACGTSKVQDQTFPLFHRTDGAETYDISHGRKRRS